MEYRRIELDAGFIALIVYASFHLDQVDESVELVFCSNGQIKWVCVAPSLSA